MKNQLVKLIRVLFGEDAIVREVYERERVVLGVNAVRQWRFGIVSTLEI